MINILSREKRRKNGNSHRFLTRLFSTLLVVLLVLGLLPTIPTHAAELVGTPTIKKIETNVPVPAITGTLTQARTWYNGQELCADGNHILLFKYKDDAKKEYFLFCGQVGVGAPINHVFPKNIDRSDTVHALAYALAHTSFTAGPNGNSVKDSQVAILADSPNVIKDDYNRMRAMQALIWYESFVIGDSPAGAPYMSNTDMKIYNILLKMIEQSKTGKDTNLTNVEFISTGDTSGKFVLTYNGYVPQHPITVTTTGTGTATVNGGTPVSIGPFAVGSMNNTVEVPVTDIKGEVQFAIKDEAPYLSGRAWGRKFIDRDVLSTTQDIILGHANFHWYEYTATVKGNEPAVQTTSVTIGGTKAVSGSGAPNDVTFGFTLTQLNSMNPNDINTGFTPLTVSRNGAGSFVFPEISGLTEGIYYYKVKETAGGGTDAGWTNDTAERIVTVKAAGNPLTATVAYPNGGLVFNNTYSPGKTGLVLNATKKVTGPALTNGQFNFAVYEGNSLVATGTNNASGVINFSEITYTAAGTHTYTVRETSTSGKGWTIDNTIHTVTVTVVDNRNGTLTATPVYPANGIVFHNTYAPEKTGLVLNATKTSAGRGLADGQFNFAVYEGNNLMATGTNNASGVINFSEITYTVAGTHTYTVCETSVSGGGWTIDDTVYTTTVTVVDNGNGNLTATPAYPANGIVFHNTYTPSKTGLVLNATKNVTGWVLTDRQFNFAVYEDNTIMATGTNNASGVINFSEITYTAAGTHIYTVRETSVSGGGWTIDNTVHTMTVTVIDNGDGTLTATPAYPANGIVFHNTYTPNKIGLVLNATKKATGWALANGQFNFAVYEGNTLVSTGTNTASGVINFSEITYTAAGIHTYTVRETSKSGKGWTVDDTVYTIAVKVIDNGDGTLTVTPSYPANGIVFHNSYTPSKTDLILNATKKATGWALANGQFNFSVYEGNTLVATGNNTAAGVINFSKIIYTAAGTHTYTIRETSESGKGWTIDDTIHTVTVTVIDNGDGTLTATPAYPANGIVFHNTYKPSKTDLVLNATKKVSGRTLTNNQFNFAVYEGNTLMATGTNTASGVINFSKITYSAAGTHSYTVRETSESGKGWTIDNTVHTVTVTVIDNGDGTLTATPSYPANGVIFHNTYTLSKTGLVLNAAKKVTGWALANEQFNFAVYEGNNLVSTGTNTASGVINFSEITYIAAGTHTYTIRETSESGKGWTIDSTVHTVTVTVIDNGDGTLTATAAYPENGVVFHNTYAPGKTDLILNATKEVTGRLLADGQFSFAVYEDNNLMATGTNTASGVINFSEITYIAAGTHTYTVRETSVSGGGWTIDGTVHTVTVSVVDNGDGTLTATPSYPDNGIVFNNTYILGKTGLVLNAAKTSVGKKLADGQFNFSVYEGDTIMAAGTNTAAGVINFSEITYTAAGTHVYTIRETSKSGGGWTIDNTIHTVTVTVIDNGDGTLTATPSYPANGITFKNTYTPPAIPKPENVSLRISKSLVNTNGNMVGTGKKFAVRLYDEYMNLVGRYILSANEACIDINGLESGSVYYLQEEIGDGFSILGFEIVGVGSVENNTIGLRIPTYEKNLVIEVIVKNQVNDIKEIPDNPPPLNPYIPPEKPPIVNIPKEKPPLNPETSPAPKPPKTGDDSPIVLWLIIPGISLAAFCGLIATKKRRRYSAK